MHVYTYIHAPYIPSIHAPYIPYYVILLYVQICGVMNIELENKMLNQEIIILILSPSSYRILNKTLAFFRLQLPQSRASLQVLKLYQSLREALKRKGSTSCLFPSLAFPHLLSYRFSLGNILFEAEAGTVFHSLNFFRPNNPTAIFQDQPNMTEIKYHLGKLRQLSLIMLKKVAVFAITETQ